MNKGSKVHCTLLDASKALDKVLLNGLYLKLIERGAPFHSHIKGLIQWVWYGILEFNVPLPYTVGCSVLLYGMVL